MNIVKKTNSNNTVAMSNRRKEWIVIHYTAGVTSRKGSAANTAAFFAGNTGPGSADFIVDDETVVQYNPDVDNRYTQHCGGSKYNTKGGSLHGVVRNFNSIGIEICSTNSTGKVTNANDKYWSFTDSAVAKAAELTRYLMKKYGIDADHVVRHYDVTGKPCPGIIGWNADTGTEAKWKAFKATLVEKPTTQQKTEKKEEKKVTLSEFKELMRLYRAELQDNDANAWSKEGREWCLKNGIIQGNGDEKLNAMWGDTVSREQMAVMLYRLAKLIGKD